MTIQQMEDLILDWLCQGQGAIYRQVTPADRAVARESAATFYGDMESLRRILPELANYLENRAQPKIKRNLPEWF